MSGVPQRLRSFLDEKGIRYEVIHHETDYTAQETAAHTHTPGRRFAKAVIVKIGGRPAMAVVPSHHVVDAERLSSAAGGAPVELASEKEVRALCSDCEPGAVPPFGNLFGLDVYASPELAGSETITCVGGSHQEAIRMAYKDFQEVVQPVVVDLSTVYHPPAAGAPARG